ncbi:protein phosphatase CheZ [Nitrospira sp. Kam-Ns4a]
MEDTNRKLYEELGELARYVERTVRRLQEVEAPMAATTAQLPQASAHLSGLARLTEEGTHRVMGLTEAIQENRARLTQELEALASGWTGARLTAADRERVAQLKRLLEEDDQRLLDIMTALSFQDLVGQRVAKIVGILDDIQHRLLEMIVVFGLAQRGTQGAVNGQAGELLRQLEASRASALKQDLVDNILEQFGFA